MSHIYLFHFADPNTKPFRTMKWETFIFCLFLVNFVNSKLLSRKYRDAGVEVTTSRFVAGPLSEFDSVAIAWFSQYVQQATFEEVEKLVNGLGARSTHCTSHGLPDPRCANSVLADFLNELCHAEDLVAKYNLTECCAKDDPERDKCFIAHKKTPEFIPPYDELTEETCKVPKNLFTAQCIYETARRYPYTSITLILIAVEDFMNMIPICCQEADKKTCLKEKGETSTKEFDEGDFMERYSCLILKKNGQNELKDFILAQLSQNHPHAEYLVLAKVAELLTLTHEECCRGASFQCFQRKVDVSEFMCTHNDTTSTHVVECLSRFKNYRFEDGSPHVKLLPTDEDVIDHQDACQHYAENHTAHLDKFLHRYSRKHHEFSVQLLLQAEEKYKALLEQCCKTEDAPACLAQLDEQVNKHIAGNIEAIKPYCDTQKKGDNGLQNMLLFEYSQIAPQLSFDDLHKYTKLLAAAGDKCCPLNDTQQLTCIDHDVDLVFGAMCLQDESHQINQQVHQCCNGHFHNRRLCFIGLQKDENYIPAPYKFSTKDLCSADNGEVQLKKQRLLVELVKYRRDITADQVHESMTEFSDALEKCCQAEDQKECFAKEIIAPCIRPFGVCLLVFLWWC